jgi:hypothetical protein
MNRRSFLKKTSESVALIGGFDNLSSVTGAATETSSAETPDNQDVENYEAPSWLRYARTVYFDGYGPPVFPRLKDFDAKRLAQITVELGGNMLRSQPIGYWAYYPSKVFPVCPELEGRDLIDEVTQACQALGIHHYCYCPYGHMWRAVSWVKQHPKFARMALRGPDGEIYGSRWHVGWELEQKTCTTGDAYREAIRAVVKELCEHDIDGVYLDHPSGTFMTGICFCDSCRKNFKKFSGMNLDRLSGFVKKYAPNGLVPDFGRLPSDVDMGALVAWMEWWNLLTKQDLLDFRTVIHGSGKFMMCHNATTWLGTSLVRQYRIPDGFMNESSRQTYERVASGLMNASMARPYKKTTQIYMGSYALTWFGEPPEEKPWVLNETDLEDGDEVCMEGFADLASGNVPLYAVANRLYYGIGSGSAEPAKEVFEVMKRVEWIHKDSVPVAYVSIVPTWESLQRWRERASSWNMMMSQGLVLAMLEARIAFDVNPSTEMSEEWLAGQRVIALCGASGVSDEEAMKLGEWVKGGGGLLATYDTGLYDAKGRMRQDGGALRQMLGVRMKGGPLESQPECYYRVKEGHEALGGYGAGAVVLGDSRMIPVEAEGGAEVVAECWNLGTGEVRGPAVIVHRYGKGKTVYVSGSLEAYYPVSRVVSVGKVLRSMIEYLGGGAPQPFRLKAPRGVYGVLRRAINGDLVLWVLANVGFKDAAAGRMRQEFVEVREVEVRIRVPEGRRVKGMELMRAGTKVTHQMEEGYAVAMIPRLHIAEIVHIKLE